MRHALPIEELGQLAFVDELFDHVCRRHAGREPPAQFRIELGYRERPAEFS
jgi:hypothetical protein